ncbi:hypothetical protein N7541_008549 [Penicillium brevicompactum]|uniref:Carboxylic ester hydrolase n=1 Tax=Penicillium brevicompactum TaxID=5074 RepID=A0A9W9QZB5_PENBR|nr:hypothetical protein N7541_008549 [Penicillium brevicompactum]
MRTTNPFFFLSIFYKARMAVLFSFIALLAACTATVLPSGDLPVVDLGYELHQAISFNKEYDLYNFSNIRYAAPPLDDLRWKLPVAPEKNRAHVQTGDVGRVCPGALPVWALLQSQWLTSYWNHTAFELSTNISSYPYNPLPADGRTTEDCLFLDVIVPKAIFDQNNNKGSEYEQLAPVLVWIHGGGQVSEEKAEHDASGLIQRSMIDEDGIVFVEINYRLGVFGFLAGNIEEDGIANFGLHDQRFALEWVADNIHLFGGDPNQVTVMGESAGAGSIVHHITAYGGDKGPAPFQQAVVQSTGWVPHITEAQQKATREQFLALLDVETIDEARKLPSEKLIAANTFQVYYTPFWGSFAYGEVVDGSYVPDTPAKLLLEGRFDHDVKLMIARVEDEGLLFTGPDSNDTHILEKAVRDFVQVSDETAKHITDVLYPPIYDGSYGYTDPVQRWALFVGDWSLNCNGDYLRRAYDNQTYSYQFNIPPALHAEDIPYTFYYNGSTLGSIFFNRPVANITVALAIQDWITSFTLYGEPKSKLTPDFPEQGSEALLMDVRLDSFGLIRDRIDGPRCQFWQTIQYLQ